MTSNEYLQNILIKYEARDLGKYELEINGLHKILKERASSCFNEIIQSGSRAKGTAIRLASDVDYFLSLSSGCNESNGGLQGIYDGLYKKLVQAYGTDKVRKQNVSFRILLKDLEVDVTPGRKHPGNTNDHSIYVSKKQTWQLTNVQRHISDVSQSGRTNEIKLLKIWRELHKLDFSSIYMEYLIIDKILLNKSTDQNKLADNFLYILNELSKDTDNPLFLKIIDPANTSNILSDLLSIDEKKIIIGKAKESKSQQYWKDIIY